MSEVLDYGADAADKQVAGTGELSELNELAQRLQFLDLEVINAENALKEAQRARDHMAEHVIPEKMKSCGQSDIGLYDGSRLKLKERVTAVITEAMQAQAFKWLRENKFDALIKREVKVLFGKGSDNEAGAFIDDLRKERRDFSDKLSVHPSTLKSFVVQQLEDGKELPLDLFGVRRVDIATIVAPKK